ncbi:complex I subunit 5 family protein [Halonatronum saccharophilum]|uniref:complex I subunit 5 family protein n=1 Tax=Halonatronum saccharophilum TaxID=150060 RepID=UPI0004822605|nr:proton-conducting transporter membrane subunit [Halonatronum saccharophilum]
MDLLVLLIVLPLFTAFSLGVISYFCERFMLPVIIGSSLLHLVLTIIVAAQAFVEPIGYNLGGWDSSIGIVLIMDSFAAIMASIISILSFLAIIYSIKYIKENILKYYILSFLLVTGTMGMVLTGDLFNLYVFFEVTSIASYSLVAIKKEDESIEGAFRYLMIGSFSGLFLLLGIITIYLSLGTLNLAQIALSFGELDQFTIISILVLMIVGFGTKFALIPLHTWLPDSYPKAPAPFNLLSSALVIKSFLYALMRIVYTLYGVDLLRDIGLEAILIYWGVFTFLIAHTMAYQQDNIKRLLGYSSIAQIGYIVVGFGVLSHKGIVGAIYHIINHSIMKGALFLALGIFIYYFNAHKIKDLKGLGFLVPRAGVIFVIGSLAIVGLPPFNGFISKWLIIEGAIEGGYLLAAFMIPVGSLISLTYYLKVFIMLYSNPKEGWAKKRVAWQLEIPALILAFFCILLGLFPQYPLYLVERAPALLLDSQNYISVFLGG